MFDSVCFKIEKFLDKDFNHLVENYLTETPKNIGNKISVNWQNLRINYYTESNLLIVKNSLHKFFNSEIGNNSLQNSNEYKFSEVLQTINLLEEGFSRKAEEMILYGRFEFGLNIKTGSLRPYEDIISRYQSIVKNFTNPFYDFYNPTGKPYSRFCSFSNYTIKCYEKNKQMGISNPKIFRFEIVLNTSVETKILLQNKRATIADLRKKEVWINCLKKIIETYNNIRVIPTAQEGAELYSQLTCYSNSLIKNDFKKQIMKNNKILKEAHDNYKNKPNNIHSVVKLGLEKYLSDFENETKISTLDIYNIYEK